MDESRNKEEQTLDESVVKKETKEEHEELDVHAEGKIADKNSNCRNDSPEYKTIEPSGDTIENGNSDECLQYRESEKNEEKNKGTPGSDNMLTDEKIMRIKIAKNENVKKSQNTLKREKSEDLETVAKTIGDRKHVKFIMNEDPKVLGDKIQRGKERGTKYVYIAGKGLDMKRQSPQFTSRRDNSPQRGKAKGKNSITGKGKGMYKKPDKPEHNSAEGSDADDSGEEYWSRSTGESSIKLDSENVKSESTKTQAKTRDDSLDRSGASKRPLRRSASAETKKGIASTSKEAKENIIKPSKNEKPSGGTDTSLEAANQNIPAFTIDIADVDGTDSDEEGSTYDRRMDNTTIEDSGHENIVEDEGPPCAEKLPDPVSDTEKVVAGPSTASSAPAVAFSWAEWYAQLLDAFTNASSYRVSLCLGWLLWAAWIMRLMGFRGWSGLAGVLGSVGLFEFMSFVEVFGLLQVMWLLRRPPNTAPRVPAPDHDGARQAVAPAGCGAVGQTADCVSGLLQNADIDPSKNSSERAIADTIL